MKINVIVSCVVAGMLVVGCADQSSINSPVTSPNDSPVLSREEQGNVSIISSSLEVDYTVVNPVDGQEYTVSGVIKYDYKWKADEAIYSLAMRPSLRIANVDIEKNFSTTVESYTTAAGSASGDVFVDKYFKIDGLSESALHLQFHLDKDVTLTTVEFVTIDQLGIEVND